MTRTLAILLLSALSCISQPLSMHDPSFLQSCSTLRVGMVGCWRLEEASGTRYDCSSKGNHLTSNNSVGQTAGKVGNCSTFVAGSSQSLTITDNASLQMGSSSFTVASWVYLTATNSFYPLIQKVDSSTAAEFFSRFNNGSDGRFSFGISTNGLTSGTITVTANNFGQPLAATWYFVVVWRDAANNQIGIQVNNGTANTASETFAVPAKSASLRLGSNGPTLANYFSGRLDEVVIHKRLLTAAEKTYLYNAGLGTHFPWAHP